MICFLLWPQTFLLSLTFFHTGLPVTIFVLSVRNALPLPGSFHLVCSHLLEAFATTQSEGDFLHFDLLLFIIRIALMIIWCPYMFIWLVIVSPHENVISVRAVHVLDCCWISGVLSSRVDLIKWLLSSWRMISKSLFVKYHRSDLRWSKSKKIFSIENTLHKITSNILGSGVLYSVLSFTHFYVKMPLYEMIVIFSCII